MDSKKVDRIIGLLDATKILKTLNDRHRETEAFHGDEKYNQKDVQRDRNYTVFDSNLRINFERAGPVPFGFNPKVNGDYISMHMKDEILARFPEIIDGVIERMEAEMAEKKSEALRELHDALTPILSISDNSSGGE